jgi:hypothetical protein
VASGGNFGTAAPLETIAAGYGHDHEELYALSRYEPFITPKPFLKRRSARVYVANTGQLIPFTGLSTLVCRGTFPWHLRLAAPPAGKTIRVTVWPGTTMRGMRRRGPAARDCEELEMRGTTASIEKWLLGYSEDVARASVSTQFGDPCPC